MFQLKTLIAAVGLAVAGSTLAAGTDLASFHSKMGGCAVCHDSATVTAVTVPDDERDLNAKCVACHGDYKALGEKSKNLPFNPHASHLGNIRALP